MNTPEKIEPSVVIEQYRDLAFGQIEIKRQGFGNNSDLITITCTGEQFEDMAPIQIIGAQEWAAFKAVIGATKL